jgi:hypothetical protein
MKGQQHDNDITIDSLGNKGSKPNMKGKIPSRGQYKQQIITKQLDSVF